MCHSISWLLQDGFTWCTWPRLYLVYVTAALNLLDKCRVMVNVNISAKSRSPENAFGKEAYRYGRVLHGPRGITEQDGAGLTGASVGTGVATLPPRVGGAVVMRISGVGSPVIGDTVDSTEKEKLKKNLVYVNVYNKFTSYKLKQEYSLLQVDGPTKHSVTSCEQTVQIQIVLWTYFNTHLHYLGSSFERLMF